MKIKFTLDSGAYAPEKAHDADAGYDLRVKEDHTITFNAVFDTGVHVQIPEGYVGYVQTKSGLNINHDIVCPTGVIDSGYTGSIKVKLYHFSPYGSYKVKAGDKIAQLVIQPIASCELVEVDSLEDTERGDGGFGSTGR